MTGKLWCAGVSKHSFFVDPGAIRGDRAELVGAVAHQIRSVLRLRPGDTVDLLDNTGFLYVARIAAVSKGGVVAELLEWRRSEAEPSVELVLYQALLKGQKMEWVLQKGTEIGINRFVPVLSERCVSRPSEAELERKRVRWETIVREAAEQSRRAIIPAVGGSRTLESACRDAAEADLALMAWEGERAVGIARAVREAGVGGRGDGRPRVALLIGPEGGFSPREAQAAKVAGVRIVGLGPRILRAETAALVGATLVLCETGDLGGCATENVDLWHHLDTDRFRHR